MACLAEPEAEHRVLGNTATPKCSLQVLKPSVIAAFQALPPELHANIMAHLDPVSQMCFGLTSRYYHQVFHACYGNEEIYNIHRNPFDLRMQVSVCEEYILHHSMDDWNFSYKKDIEWQPSLGYMLRKEKTLWGNLIECWGCSIYKPEKAYERFALEEETFLKFEEEIEALESEDVEWYNNQCRKCRVKILLLVFGRSEEFFEGPEICHEESIGLRRQWKDEGEKQKALETASCSEEYYATRLNYERWEDVFRRLCI